MFCCNNNGPFRALCVWARCKLRGPPSSSIRWWCRLERTLPSILMYAIFSLRNCINALTLVIIIFFFVFVVSLWFLRVSVVFDCECMCVLSLRVSLSSSSCKSNAEIRRTHTQREIHQMHCFTSLHHESLFFFHSLYWALLWVFFFSPSSGVLPDFSFPLSPSDSALSEVRECIIAPLLPLKTDRNEFNMCVLNEYVYYFFFFFCCARRTRKKAI